MQRSQLWKPILVLLLLCGFASTAQAAPINFYIGASLGEAFDSASGLSEFDFDVDADDNTWKVFAGASIGRIFGVEVARHEFGNVTCCNTVSDIDFSLDTEGISFAAMAGFPVWRARLFAKLGVMAWEVDGDLETLGGAFDVAEDGEDLMAGIGVDFKVTGGLSVRAEWEVFEFENDDIGLASLGVQFKF